MYINKIRKGETDYDISNGETYSTDEQVIGTWVNGKPLYQKTVYFDKTQYKINGETTLPHNISDVDCIWLRSGFGYRGYDNYFQNIPNAHTDMTNWSIGVYNISPTNFALGIGKCVNTQSMILDYIYLTFNYTKTTDSSKEVN